MQDGNPLEYKGQLLIVNKQDLQAASTPYTGNNILKKNTGNFFKKTQEDKGNIRGFEISQKYWKIYETRHWLMA